MENYALSQVKNFRYERKFYINNLSKEQIESILKHHPAIFTEIYHQRFVNNIYLDSFNMRNYYDNINGQNRRLKVRIRWYGDLFGVIKNPILELKLKHNFHIGKVSHQLQDFVLDNNLSLNNIQEVFDNSDLPEILKFHLEELQFSFLNRYSRRYFLSSNKKFRITLDINMKVFKLSPFRNNFLHQKTDINGVILELKYNKAQDEYVDDITNYFPFRVTRSSKYVLGIENLAF